MNPRSLPCTLQFEVEGRRFHVDLPSDDVILGRSRSCDLVIPDRTVSRRHARITHDDTGWWLVDLGARNGVFMNDRRVNRGRIGNGDRFKLGDVIIRCALGAAPRQITFRKA